MNTPLRKVLIVSRRAGITTETPGHFHTWGYDVDDGATYSTAIVELEDGTVTTPPADKIRFVEPLP